jgi:hypothetical protein
LEKKAMIRLISINFDYLPAQLLPVVKEHLRVEFNRDDAYIEGAIARAIAEIESITDLSINPSVWQWQPSNCYLMTRYLRIPKTPIREVLDSKGSVVELVWNAPAAYLDNSYSRNQKFTIHAGYSELQQIAPAVMNVIFLLTGTLYEQREAVQAGTFNELPDMANRLMAGLWRPSC